MDYQDGIELLPHYMQDGMRRYIEQGTLPGSFLQAVLSNDFIAAVNQADTTNTAALKEYALFLTTFAPAACHGSREAMLKWQRRGGLQRFNSTRGIEHG